MAKITAMKRIAVYSDIVDGKKKTKGRELWQIEIDGLGNIETEVIIPALTHHTADKKARAVKVEALVRAAVKDRIAKLAHDHAG